MPEPAIGIEIGTLESVVAAATPDGETVIVPGAKGRRVTATTVWFGPDGETLAGDRAAAAAASGPGRAVLDVRSHLGDPEWAIDVDGVAFAAAEVLALLLVELGQDVEREVGPVAGAVVAVPAWYHDVQRRGILDAAAGAGLPVLQIVNEPYAAALPYATRDGFRGTALVCQLLPDGVEAAVLNVESPDHIELVAADGDRNRGDGDGDGAGAPDVAQVRGAAKRALSQGGVKPAAIGAVIVAANGVADVRPVQKMLGELCGTPHLERFDPEEIIARGAAIRAVALLAQRDGVGYGRAA